MYLTAAMLVVESVMGDTGPASGEDSSTRAAAENPAQDRRSIREFVQRTEILQDIGMRAVLPVASMFERLVADQDVFARAYRPDVIAKNLKTGAEIDKALDKALARFYNLKAYQNLRAAKPKMKQIDAIQPPANETIENKKVDRPN